MTSAVSVTVNGHPVTEVIGMTLSRDLQNIAGTFSLEVADEARLLDALLAYIGQPGAYAVRTGPGLPVQIAIDGETVLIGWIEDAEYDWEASRISARLAGRDKTGDLVECAALPFGPNEFRGADLLHVANVVCPPFGITVRADVDIGAPFDRLSLHKHMTAMAFLESAARQRSVLLTSDGIGGLVLTRGGSTRGPAPLRIGENAQKVRAGFKWTKRFSDYFVMQDTAKKRTGTVALDHTVTPLTSAPVPAAAPAANSAAESAAIGAVGRATDPEVTRWRPTVRLTRSQSGMRYRHVEQALFWSDAVFPVFAGERPIGAGARSCASVAAGRSGRDGGTAAPAEPGNVARRRRAGAA